MTDPWLFLLAVATILATPGPTNTLMATSGATVGLVRSIPLLFGALVGYLLAILAIRLVVAPLIEMSPVVGTALRLAAAAYLVWLAIRLWRQPLAADSTGRAIGVIDMFVTTLLNPKGLIFALTIFPAASAAGVWYFAVFSVTVLAAGGGWIALGALLRGAVGSGAGYIPRVASIALLGFAGFLVSTTILHA